MNQNHNDRIAKKYRDIIADSDDSEIEERLFELKDDPDIDDLCFTYCNELLYLFCARYAKYPEQESVGAREFRQHIIKSIDTLPFKKKNDYLCAVSCFFKGDRNGCLKHLRKHLDFIRAVYEKEPMGEADWSDLFLDTFKNAYPGFWDEIAKMLSAFPCKREIVDLCHLVDAYYQCDTDEAAVDILLPFYGAHPDLLLPKELLGFTYVSLKMWNNALAYLEQVEQSSVLFYACDIAFQIAWCYGKLKDYKTEEAYYRKCLDANPYYSFAENNLGFSLYKQKKYAQALEHLQHCLDENQSLPFAANNYVRVLLASGQYKTAYDFIESKAFKVSADIVKRVRKHKPANVLPKSVITEPLDEENETDAEEAPADFGIKRQQFSSEKSLENELVARIESGQSIFNLQLKMYKRKGEYGRQYPIANGKWRLDLLCEDGAGNLYVIELKKDSGYDDPYEQTKRYVEWLTANKCPKGKSVFGIICLNSPTKAVVTKVRNDARIKLFEYQISYTEIK